MKFVQKSEAAIINVLQNSCCEKSSKFHWKTSVLESFLKKEIPVWVFPVNCKISQNTFFTEHIQGTNSKN